MEASHLTVRETVSASRKLGAAEARKLLEGMTTLVIARGRKTEVHDLTGGITDSIVEAMLGPTGNLRAPTAKSGKTVFVGFNEETWRTGIR